ncbi:MAG: prepilin-type N-terminal cleavage/methylation domain-containing protein [Candidatus Omnitrophica bacterium]|nr:prepilin-type N-terminal cleavage/methylation domain-containing protein [Candidatus Omnitrophota bacterium]
MNMKSNKCGFTLLEIIIVIIIVGVLASLALPRLFNTINYSRSTEALNAIGVLKRGADLCAMAVEATGGGAGQYGQCDTFAEIGIEDPGTQVGANFTYAINAFASPNWVVVATDVGGAGTITFTYNTLTGAITRVGTGSFTALK